MLRAKMLAACLLGLILSFPAWSRHVLLASAQEARPPETSPVPAGEVKTHKGERRGDEANLIVKEEEGKADPNEVFRHSDAVKRIARLTGLSPDAVYWICFVLNFIAVVAILWVLLRKALPTVFRNRTEAIQRRLEEARKTSEEARKRLAEVEARLSRLDSEIAQMQREAEASGQHEEERIMAAAEAERRRIVEAAEQEIATAANAARRELKAYAAELGVALAEKRIRVSENADRELVRDFTSRLGRDGN